ncbi:MAG: phosphodiester glycosidase family protein [Pirellulales bacterium]|nr:phosphodiester glycosidase family protein [Pirellulales bacterium]
MRKIPLLALVLAVALLGRMGTAYEPIAFQSLCRGVAYRHDVRAEGPLSIHVLRIDRRQQWDLQTGLGQGTVFGLEPLDGIASRTAAAAKKRAVAAINGDFFVIQQGPYQGDPRGLQIARGELVSRPTGNSFWIAPDGKPKIGPVKSKLRVLWPDGKTETPLGLNEARKDDEAILYTPTLGLRPNEPLRQPPTTRTAGGKEFVLERVAGRPWLPIQAGKTYSARIAWVCAAGNSPLQCDKLILSIGPKLAPPAVKAGDVLQLAIETFPDLNGVKTAIGAGRVLIKNGKSPDLGPENQPRHPRSMIGWNDRHLFFLVVDGRQRGLSIGMTYPEMAALMREYGCVEAVELDGGGSSTLWALGKILNSPSDGHPRAIANALILFRNERDNLPATPRKDDR